MDHAPYSGSHLLIDLHGCEGLADRLRVERALIAAAAAAGATVLDILTHHFGEEQGVTGIALLAESHISIHTWPERSYAAVDIFLCGQRHDLNAALEIIRTAFVAKAVSSSIIQRGYGVGLDVTTV